MNPLTDKESHRFWNTLEPSLKLDGSMNGLAIYWRDSPGFIEELARALQGKRVLEVFAGNGYLAALLAQNGIQITATTKVHNSIDHCDRGVFHEIHDLDAVQAVEIFGSENDVLLMCWPTVTLQAVEAAVLMNKPIVFIGEFTDYQKNQLGGCATDEFFELFEVAQELGSYKGNIYERACIGSIVPNTEKQQRHSRQR